jgi:hypothetical protein
MWRPTCSAAPMPSSAASAWLTSTNRRCRSTIASPTGAAACTSIRMFPVPARCHSVMEGLALRSCWILLRGRLTPTPPRDFAICPFYPATPGSSVRRVSCYRSTLAGEGRLTGRDRGLSSWPTAPKCGVRALFVGIIGCAACPRTHVWLDTLVSLQEEVQPYGGHEAADR